MAASYIRLEAGEYVADTAVVLSLMQGDGRQVSYREVGAGETFEVPAHVNQFWTAATYHPDFGDSPPKFRRLPK
jgi:hypothetical protein